jgi:phenylpyruvate tautomerase PptA (4-oxalocrotonate tautomerase family)
MKKILLAISLVVAMAGFAWGQGTETRGSATANSDTSVRKDGRQLDLQSGTQLAGQLENTLDARRAKPGDRVALKTIQTVKQNGQVIVPKGAQLIGRVTDVQQQTKSNVASSITVVFDRLRTGSTETAITASILSITRARSQGQTVNDDVFGSDTMASSGSRSSSSASSSSQRGGGGLLGGVGNTVGGVVNTSTSTVGSVAGSSTSAVGNTVAATTNTAGNTGTNLSGALRGLQITQSSDASAQGGSTLSLSGSNLRLDSGTTFNLAVSSSTSAGNGP